MVCRPSYITKSQKLVRAKIKQMKKNLTRLIVRQNMEEKEVEENPLQESKYFTKISWFKKYVYSYDVFMNFKLLC